MAYEIQHLNEVMARVARSCVRAQQNVHDITVVAATKYAGAEQINLLLAAGVSDIGENIIQDAIAKLPNLMPCKKHFIGHLQSNKVGRALKLFDRIDSVDSFELAAKIDFMAEKLKKRIPILLQVNIGADENKFGLKPSEVLGFIEKIRKFYYLDIRGLMAILPYFDDPEKARPYFRSMKTLFDFCRERYKGFEVLSMGMSHDFEIAIEEGATEVRVGSFLFKD